MSRIQLNIERLVLNGFAPGDAKALNEALQSHLRQVLLDRATRDQWASPHRTPVLKLGRMPLQSGAAGARKLGRQMAGAIGKGLRP
jgi:hypothetical protein